VEIGACAVRRRPGSEMPRSCGHHARLAARGGSDGGGGGGGRLPRPFGRVLAWACVIVATWLMVAPGWAAGVEFPSSGEFDAHVGRYHHALVLVGLSKGCAKCNILLGELERVRLLRGAADLVAIVAVDAREHKRGLRDFEVTEVPTLLWFSRAGGANARAANMALQTGTGVVRRQRVRARGLPDPEPFSGHPLTAAGIAAFLNEKLGPGKATVGAAVALTGGGGGGAAAAAASAAAAAAAAEGAGTVEFVGVVLDDRTFQATVGNPDTFTLVLFCNSWHAECKAFRETCVRARACPCACASSFVGWLVCAVMRVCVRYFSVCVRARARGGAD
jgi:hypothetical protein